MEIAVIHIYTKDEGKPFYAFLDFKIPHEDKNQPAGVMCAGMSAEEAIEKTMNSKAWLAYKERVLQPKDPDGPVLKVGLSG